MGALMLTSATLLTPSLVESLQATGGSTDRVAGYKVAVGVAGQTSSKRWAALCKSQLSAGPRGSVTPNVLSSDLYSRMEKAWQGRRFQYRMGEPAFPGGMLEGKAARRDLSKLEMWFDRNLMGFRQRPSPESGKEPPCAILQTQPTHQKVALQERTRGRVGGHPNFVVDKLNTSLQCALVAAELN